MLHLSNAQIGGNVPSIFKVIEYLYIAYFRFMLFWKLFEGEKICMFFSKKMQEIIVGNIQFHFEYGKLCAQCINKFLGFFVMVPDETHYIAIVNKNVHVYG